MATRKKMNFRDISFGLRQIRLLGLHHSDKGVAHIPENLKSIAMLRPEAFLVETSAKSLELSEFVWKTRNPSQPLEEFCAQESYVNETLAFAGKQIISQTAAPIIPIDIDPGITRRRLAKSALFHPVESLLLISRYHGKNGSISSIDEVGPWRAKFKKTCPHAFEILFTDREKYMCSQIDDFSRKYKKILVLMGLSHVDAIYNLLVP